MPGTVVFVSPWFLCGSLVSSRGLLPLRRVWLPPLIKEASLYNKWRPTLEITVGHNIEIKRIHGVQPRWIHLHHSYFIESSENILEEGVETF